MHLKKLNHWFILLCATCILILPHGALVARQTDNDLIKPIDLPSEFSTDVLRPLENGDKFPTFTQETVFAESQPPGKEFESNLDWL